MDIRGSRLGFVRRWGSRAATSAAMIIAAGANPSIGQEQAPPIPGAPAPNGYDDLLAAALQVRKTLGSSVDFSKAPAGQVREALEANREALATARDAFGRPCFVPLRYEPIQIQLALDRASALRDLARLMSAEARLAEAEGRRPDAIRASTDLLRLGQATGRGGLLIESLTGVAIESYGVDSLARLMPRMSEEELSETIGALAQLERTAEPFPVVADREREFAREAHGLKIKAVLLVSPQLKMMLQQSIDAAERSFLRAQAKRRLLSVELAIRLHQIKQGADPTSLAALTPSILRDKPIDPYTGGPFLYKTGADGHQVYSVGPDGDDDGGRAIDPRDPDPDGDVVLGPVK